MQHQAAIRIGSTGGGDTTLLLVTAGLQQQQPQQQQPLDVTGMQQNSTLSITTMMQQEQQEQHQQQPVHVTRTGNGLNVVGEPLAGGNGNGTVDAVGGNMTGSNVTIATVRNPYAKTVVVQNHNSTYNRVVGETIILRWGRRRYNRHHNNKRPTVGTGPQQELTGGQNGVNNNRVWGEPVRK